MYFASLLMSCHLRFDILSDPTYRRYALQTQKAYGHMQLIQDSCCDFALLM